MRPKMTSVAKAVLIVRKVDLMREVLALGM